MNIEKSSKEYCYICGESLSGAPKDIEHVVPANLFERGRKTKGLITLPAHKACNSGFSMDDEYFRLCMTLAAIPHDPIAKKLWEGPVMRGFHRAEMPGLKTATLKSLKPVDVRTSSGVYLGTREAMLQDATRIQRVVNRICRGLYASLTGKVLGLDWPVSSDLIDPEAAKPFFKAFKIHLSSVGSGAFHYNWKHLEEDDREGFFWLTFYHTVHFWGYTGTRIKDLLVDHLTE